MKKRRDIDLLYRITRKFTNGLLSGLTHVEITRVPFREGFKCDKPAGGSPYVITKVEIV